MTSSRRMRRTGSRKNGLRIAILGYNEYKPRSFEAGPNWPGVAWSEDSHVLRDIAAARAAGADIVIPFMHWGWERERQPSARQRRLARLMIDAGADAVVGGHPHVTQGDESYAGKPIIYSLGNFVFDGFDTGPSRPVGCCACAWPRKACWAGKWFRRTWTPRACPQRQVTSK